MQYTRPVDKSINKTILQINPIAKRLKIMFKKLYCANKKRLT